MLIDLGEYRLSQFIRKHFSTLFSLQLKIFEKFLESCFFKHKSMKDTKSLKWIFKEDEALIDFHTSYLGNEFYKQLNYKPEKIDKALMDKTFLSFKKNATPKIGQNSVKRENEDTIRSSINDEEEFT